MTIFSGKLRHRVRIEKLSNVLDSSGLVVQDPISGAIRTEWTEVITCWAEIAPLSAREFIQSSAKQSVIVARILIRHVDGLDASMRIVHLRKDRPDVIYNPQAFLPDLESGLEYLNAPCSSGVGNGQ